MNARVINFVLYICPRTYPIVAIWLLSPHSARKVIEKAVRNICENSMPNNLETLLACMQFYGYTNIMYISTVVIRLSYK